MGFADHPRPCVAVVIERAGRVLLLRRGPACSWPGYWSLPGGRVELGETLVECCRRKLREETGLEAGPFVLCGLTEAIVPPPYERLVPDLHLIGLVYRAQEVRGKPRNRETDRHDAIGWYPWDHLPAPLMPPVAQFVEAYFNSPSSIVAVGGIDGPR